MFWISHIDNKVNFVLWQTDSVISSLAITFDVGCLGRAVRAGADPRAGARGGPQVYCQARDCHGWAHGKVGANIFFCHVFENLSENFIFVE
jgi:hypothetical protein